MKTLLQISASIFSASGQSTQLVNAFAKAWVHAHPGGRVVERDLVAEPIPHLDLPAVLALSAKSEERTEDQRGITRISDQLIAELNAADEIVIGIPMYNFGIPSQLKAYFDLVARAGVTFRYTAIGPQGLITGKKAYVITTRGGMHYGKDSDSESAHIRTFLGFIGIDDVEFIYVEGLNLGAEAKSDALNSAMSRIRQLARASASSKEEA